MKNQQLIKDVTASLESLGTEERRKVAVFYYPTKMRVIGVSNPDQKTVVKNLRLVTRNETTEAKITLAKDLVSTAIFECQQVAYEFLAKDKKLMSSLSAEDLIVLDQGQDNWVSVDTFSAYLLGVAWRLGIVDDQWILEKAGSSDFWIRRQSLVATLGWNQKSRGGKGNTEKTLMICSLFVDDHQDMINKALSWALRELSKTDKEAVVEFMQDFEPRLHGRVRREVWAKIVTGVKNPK